MIELLHLQEFRRDRSQLHKDVWKNFQAIRTETFQNVLAASVEVWKLSLNTEVINLIRLTSLF